MVNVLEMVASRQENKPEPPTEAGPPAAEPPAAGPSASGPPVGPGPPVSGSSAKGKVCVACLTKDDHNVEECPLLFAFAVGDETEIRKAKAFCKRLSRLPAVDTDVQEWENAHGRAWIPIQDTQIRRIRGDGHCLFAAIYASIGRSLGHNLADTTVF